MRKFLKPLIFTVLVAVLVTVLVIPTKVYSDPLLLPGLIGGSEYGTTCFCPRPALECGCCFNCPPTY